MLGTLNYGNYGTFFIMGNAGCISSTVAQRPGRPIHKPKPGRSGNTAQTTFARVEWYSFALLIVGAPLTNTEW